ncbi:MAG: response regulator [Archaeoglobaceae archaeon]
MTLRILVADDDDGIREVLKVMLKEYEVFEATDGVEAVNLYKAARPDVVFMDIFMPRLDGIEATKEIIKIDPNAVIIGITAFARSKKEEMLKAGAKDVIEKPFTRKKLKEVINRYVAKKVEC